MFKKNKFFFPLVLLFFYTIEIWLLKSRQYQIGIFFYFFLVLILFTVNEKYIISFFVFSLPLLPIIPTDYKLFNFVGPHEIIYGSSFLLLLKFVRGRRILLNRYQRLSISFIYLLFFLHMYILFKDSIFEINTEYKNFWMITIKRFIRYFLYYGSLILLIKSIYFEGYLNSILEGMKYAVVTIAVSMYFSPFLILLGSSIGFDELRKERLLSGEYLRYIGFYGAGGDENSAGIFLVGVLGFFLAIYEKGKNLKRYIIYIGFAVLGVLLTGSRTAFLVMLIIISIFFVVNKKGAIRVSILSSIVVFYFLFYERLNLVIQRFIDPSAMAAIDPNEMGRVGKWIRYFDWISDHPITLLFGNQELMSYNRAPHNYFIFLLYHVGLILLMIFLFFLFKLLNMISFKNRPNTLRNVYYILPFLFVLMTVNSFGSSIYLWLYIPIGSFYYGDIIQNK